MFLFEKQHRKSRRHECDYRLIVVVNNSRNIIERNPQNKNIDFFVCFLRHEREQWEYSARMNEQKEEEEKGTTTAKTQLMDGKLHVINTLVTNARRKPFKNLGWLSKRYIIIYHWANVESDLLLFRVAFLLVLFQSALWFCIWNAEYFEFGKTHIFQICRLSSVVAWTQRFRIIAIDLNQLLKRIFFEHMQFNGFILTAYDYYTSTTHYPLPIVSN